MKRWLKPGDLALLALGLTIGTGSWLAVRFLENQRDASSVIIQTYGKKFEINLKDTTLIIPGPLGETELRIEDGEAWIQKASCPNKLCVRQGRISRPGESIICLPNKIVITIKGLKTDALTY